MIKFECSRDELSTVVNALYLYRSNVREKMIKAKDKQKHKTLSNVFERIDKLYNFFLRAGSKFKDA